MTKISDKEFKALLDKANTSEDINELFLNYELTDEQEEQLDEKIMDLLLEDDEPKPIIHNGTLYYIIDKNYSYQADVIHYVDSNKLVIKIRHKADKTYLSQYTIGQESIIKLIEYFKEEDIVKALVDFFDNQNKFKEFKELCHKLNVRLHLDYETPDEDLYRR